MRTKEQHQKYITLETIKGQIRFSYSDTEKDVYLNLGPLGNECSVALTRERIDELIEAFTAARGWTE